MLYKKNDAPELSRELFKNPTSEYRGTPFWAWNAALEKDELLRQIDVFKEMGLGGFHMHVRTGMDTEYLSPEFFSLIRACVDHAKEKEMLAWLYDEDRWPSGSAGGFVTKDPAFRQRYLMFTPFANEDSAPTEVDAHVSSAAASRTNAGKLLCRYEVVLDENNCLASYRRLADGEEAKAGEVWYAYIETPRESCWFNNQTYVDTLNPKAIERFVELTYGGYENSVGEDFGGAIPAIFTDEPQFTKKSTLPFPDSKTNVFLPYTDDIEDTYRAAYGDSLIDHLPELIWELPSGVSVTRYRYHDHISERFAAAFADTCGKWCNEHGIYLTGHMMDEPTLSSQSGALGDAMRSYRSFGIPGIDMLCSRLEYTTAKQAQSAVHQYGREGMLSELYGVTGWDFDFRGHKLHGDWQAALGVTVRVQHLSWVSMKGEAKRDYPASISYQSPWYERYRYVEDHFARINTAMTRGVPDVRIGVIHPVESYWLHFGPSAQTAEIRDRMDQNFLSLTSTLLLGSIDFDYICESLLPDQCAVGGAPLKVGKMAYDVIIVPCCETLRASTLERLEAFAAAGGKLIFLGDLPTLCDATPSDRAIRLAESAEVVPFDRSAILSALDSYRSIELRNESGYLTNRLLHQLRIDGNGKWLFIANAKEPYNVDLPRSEKVRIRVKGHYKVTEYDTLSGETKPIACRFVGDFTEFEKRFYEYDSLLCRLDNADEPSVIAAPEAPKKEKAITVPSKVEIIPSEPNVLLLDQAEFSLDGEEFSPTEEILRIDTACRIRLGWLSEQMAAVERSHPTQPWVIEKKPIEHSITLRFRFFSELALDGTALALEDASLAEITLNGTPVTAKPEGYYTDRSIERVALPTLKIGENVLVIKLPFGERIGPEWCYLLGDFGVRISGVEKTVTARESVIGFDDITTHGYPFYGGAMTYRLPITTGKGSVSMTVPHYRGAVMTVLLDGKELGDLAYPPYRFNLGEIGEGEHLVEIRLYVSRQNAFGHLHHADSKLAWVGPTAWRSDGAGWTNEYRLRPEGILSTPRMTETES